MDVLEALIIGLFAKTRGCKYQDTETTFASEEAILSNGRASLLATRKSDGRSDKSFSGPSCGKTDRTAWGSYMERAPPILPANTCVPGFEDELLLASRRQHGALDSDDPYDGDNEGEQSDSNEHTYQDGGRKQDDKRSSDAYNVPTRSTRDASHLPFSSLISSLNLSLLPTIFSHGNPSSLYGSTLRPAATTLRAIKPNDDTEGTSKNSSNATKMAAKTRTWISLWFLLTAPVIFWDAAYCFMRPRSFKGGDLHWIWKPYEIYQEVDFVYGVEAYNRGDGFANAQSFLNVIETLMNLYYLYAQHVLASPTAPLVGFAAVVMTLSKTILYWAQEYFCGGCSVGHNDLWTLFWFWILPNGLWLIFPSLILLRLARDMADGLTMASKVDATKKD